MTRAPMTRWRAATLTVTLCELLIAGTAAAAWAAGGDAWLPFLVACTLANVGVVLALAWLDGP